jgi:hypothetical protein
MLQPFKKCYSVSHRLVEACRPFRFKKFLDFDIIVFSFLFNKHCSIIKLLGLKDLSHDLHINYTIRIFYLYLMLRIYVARFNVMEQGLNKKRVGSDLGFVQLRKIFGFSYCSTFIYI